jgi:ubiquitin-like domain-containing CTD phosphatase 1
LELKLTELGILTHPAYKVCFVLDKTSVSESETASGVPNLHSCSSLEYVLHYFSLCSSMFSIHSPDGAGSLRKHHVKALDLIWRKFPAWNASNSIHIDDLQRNFALNPRSGLKILPYKNSDVTRATDQELPLLAKYLAHIAPMPDFNKLDHSAWKKVASAAAGAPSAAASGQQ